MGQCIVLMSKQPHLSSRGRQAMFKIIQKPTFPTGDFLKFITPFRHGGGVLIVVIVDRPPHFP